MPRYALPFAAAAVASLAPHASIAQQQIASRSLHPTPLTVRWSMPVEHVTRRLPSWNATDVRLAGGFLAVLWVDAAQTRQMARQNWNGFYEANPLIGPRPTVGQLNTYTAVAAVTTLGVAAALPPRARRWWLVGALAVEMFAVTATTSAGVPLRFR